MVMDRWNDPTFATIWYYIGVRAYLDGSTWTGLF
jgi:hypothetical protein